MPLEIVPVVSVCHERRQPDLEVRELPGLDALDDIEQPAA